MGGEWGRGEDPAERCWTEIPGNLKKKPIQFKRKPPENGEGVEGLAWLHFLHSFHLISRAFLGVEIFEFFGI